MAVKAVIFDLDGVIVSTDEYHYLGWKRLADEEGIYFDRQINHRLRGVSRMDSLEIILERSESQYSDAEKADLADRKNSYYRDFLADLTPADILPGAMQLMEGLKHRGVKVAVASASKNTPTILRRIGLDGFFDAVVDGNDITRSKPDPQVFAIAAERLGVSPDQCLVVEDAAAGVAAAGRAGMKCLAVGAAAGDKNADASAAGLADVTVESVLAV